MKSRLTLCSVIQSGGWVCGLDDDDVGVDELEEEVKKYRSFTWLRQELRLAALSARVLVMGMAGIEWPANRLTVFAHAHTHRFSISFSLYNCEASSLLLLYILSLVPPFYIFILSVNNNHNNTLYWLHVHRCIFYFVILTFLVNVTEGIHSV